MILFEGMLWETWLHIFRQWSFRKEGLPHVHMALFLSDADKPHAAEDVDLFYLDKYASIWGVEMWLIFTYV